MLALALRYLLTPLIGAIQYCRVPRGLAILLAFGAAVGGLVRPCLCTAAPLPPPLSYLHLCLHLCLHWVGWCARLGVLVTRTLTLARTKGL